MACISSGRMSGSGIVPGADATYKTPLYTPALIIERQRTSASAVSPPVYTFWAMSVCLVDKPSACEMKRDIYHLHRPLSQWTRLRLAVRLPVRCIERVSHRS
jgi:hypothetical protein